MPKLSHMDLRAKFSSFWERNNHVEVPPISLVPENDPTTLFTGSGMQQFVPYFLGQKHPSGKRIYNVQRAVRAQDIDEVGDNRHDTFFEMMGNWSLGDYFKKEQVPWFWKFLTVELKLPKNRLYVSCFEGNKEVPKDTETAEIWQSLGVPPDHIFFYPASENWWSRAGEPKDMPPGEVGGPDSEVFFEFTNVKHDPKFGKVCHPSCDCGRFLEIGNSVFIQYLKNKDGSLSELPNKNVDFGGGLERLLMAANNEPDMFKTDVYSQIITTIKSVSGKTYEADYEQTYAFRILADHLRTATMLLADGVTPSNTEQGYFLRRLVRRAVRFGKILELDHGFTPDVSLAVINTFEQAYPHVKQQEKAILKELSAEEDKFRKTLDRGLREFTKMTQDKVLSSKEAFLLYESYGFPVEMTRELAEENQVQVDLSDFESEIKRHKEASKKGLTKKFRGGLADHSEMTIKYHTATHLLHRALRDVLGDHVQQKGSNITGERLRFDFAHTAKMTDEEITNVTSIVNEKIKQELPVTKKETTYEEAKKEGAMAFFGQRYPEKVTVYTIGDYSKEICGGPHVKNTKDLGTFRIFKESSASAGIRRVYAILE